MIHNVICIFYNTEGNFRYGQFLRMRTIFQIFSKWLYSRIEQKNVSFIYVRILILKIFFFIFNMRVF